MNPRAKNSTAKRHSRNVGDETSFLIAIHDALTPFCLWLAQMLSILGCVLSLAYPIYVVYPRRVPLPPGSTPWYAPDTQRISLLDTLDATGFATFIGSTILGFVFCYALAIVFSRTRASIEKTVAEKTKRIV